VESILESHVDWVQLIKTDDNFKNILQVKIQKEFKTTPDYIEISHDGERGYQMGVYLCIGKPIHQFKPYEAVPYSHYGSFATIQQDFISKGYAFVFLGSGTHKIKKKAEQIACEEAIDKISIQ
jgi:dsRNA-specific ribonuclease